MMKEIAFNNKKTLLASINISLKTRKNLLKNMYGDNPFMGVKPGQYQWKNEKG